MDLMLTGNDALAVDISRRQSNDAGLERNLPQLHRQQNWHSRAKHIQVEGLPVTEVEHRFEPPQNRLARKSTNDDLPA